MRQTKYLLVLGALSVLFLASSIATSSDKNNVSANNPMEMERLEARIKNLEEKLTKKNASFKINGFINASFARSDDDSLTESWGGITNESDFGSLSKVGIQLSFSPNSSTQITTQLVSRGEEEWGMEAEWAYLSFKPSNSLTLRFGRQKASLYLLSEYIEVGYANPWIYAPDEVYGITGDSTYDGVTLLYTIPGNQWDTTLQGMWGNNYFYTAVAGDVTLNDMISLSLTSRSEHFTLRLGYNVVTGNLPDVSIPLPTIPGSPIVAGDTLNFTALESDIRYLTVGIIHDNDRWLLMSEYAQLEIDSWFPDVTGAYLMAGYRFGKAMPHFTIAKMSNQDPGARDIATVVRSSVTLALPDGVAGSIADASMVQNQTTYTLGMRYELLPAVSLKAELSHITDFDDSGGQFLGSAPPTKESVNILKFSIDSIF